MWTYAIIYRLLILNERVRIKKRGVINIRFIEMQSLDNVDIVPESEMWRINLLSTFMDIKISKTHSMYNMDKVKTDLFIASLCKT